MTGVLKTNEEYSKIVYFGAENNQWIDRVGAFFLALTPILQHYNGLIVDAGVSVLVVLFPWIALRIVNKIMRYPTIKRQQLYIVLGLLMFLVFRTVIHGFTIMFLIYNVVMIVYFIGAAIGCINVKYFLKSAAGIAMLACILIMIQYVCYYILGFHLQLVPTSFVLPEAEAWKLGAQTGLAGITGKMGSLYRPSAFFLEPSHMFLYTFPHIFMMLFSPKMNWRKIGIAILFTIGMVCSTSGMGIVTVAGAWGAFFAFANGRENRLDIRNALKARNFTMLMALAFAGVAAIICVPFLRAAVMRFLDSSNRGAIAGRTRLANDLLATLEGTKLWFGVTNSTTGIGFNMSGYAATRYKFGIIGTILSYTTYVWGIIGLRRQYFWISILVVAVSFFSAQTHGTFYMMYYVLIILEGNYVQLMKKKDVKATNV